MIYPYPPFFILPLYASIEKLECFLIEAATPLKTFQTVIFPLTRPSIIAGSLLVFVPALGMFAISQLMGGGTDPTLGEVIQNQFMQAKDWPFATAFGC